VCQHDLFVQEIESGKYMQYLNDMRAHEKKFDDSVVDLDHRGGKVNFAVNFDNFKQNLGKKYGIWVSLVILFL